MNKEKGTQKESRINLMKIRTNPYINYTLFFLAIVLLGYFPLFFNYYEMPWIGDGVQQYIPFLSAFKENLQQLFVQHQLPSSWDWTYGMGASQFSKFAYYNLGDMFSYLGALAPAKYLTTWYGILIFVRVYLAGLSGLVLFRSYGYSSRLSGIVALVYAWSPFAIYNISRHPMFITPLIIFPLLILGVNRLFNQKDSRLLIVTAVMAIISNFYFAWQMALGCLVYIILRYLCQKKSKGDLLAYGKRLLGPVVIIIGLSAFFTIPLLQTVSTMSRGEDVFSNGLVFYSLKYYLKLPVALFSFISNGHGFWVVGGFVMLIVPAIVYSLRRFNRYKVLNYALITGLLFLLIPPLASLTVLGGSPIHRWLFMMSLVFAFSLLNFLSHMTEVNQKDLKVTLVTFFVMWLMWYVGNDFSLGSARFAWSVMFAVAFSSIFLLYQNPEKVRKLLVLLLFTNVLVNIMSFNSSRQGDAFDHALSTEGFAEWTTSNAFYGISSELTSPQNRLHIDKNMQPKTRGNAASNLGIYNLMSYNSIQNKYVNELASKVFGFKENPNTPLKNMTNDPTVLKLLGAKYLVLDNETKPPRGYEKVTEQTEDYTLYETDTVAPLFSLQNQNNMVSESALSQLKQVEKQAYLTEGVVVNDDKKAVPSVASETKNISYQLIEQQSNKPVQAADGKYTLKANQKYEVNILADSDSRQAVYLHFDHLEEQYLGIREKYHRQVMSNKEEIETLSSEKPLSSVNKLKLDKLTMFEEGNTYAKYDFVMNHLLDSDTGKVALGIETNHHSYHIDNGDGKLSVNGLTPVNYGEYQLDTEGSHIVLENKTNNDVVVSGLGIFSYNRQLAAEAKAISQRETVPLTVDGKGVSGNIIANEGDVLVSRIPYSKGWHAYVDGEEVPVKRVNYAFVGFGVPEGKHQIELIYKEPGLKLGGILTGVTTVCWVGVSLYRRKSNKNENIGLEES